MGYLVWVAGAMLAWGVWGFIPKLAAGRFDNLSWMFWSWLGAVPVVATCLAFLRFAPQSGGGAWYLPMLTGACGLGGGLMYYKAMTLCGPNTATVVVVSAMYPVVSVLLGILVTGDRLSLGQGLGILLCLMGAAVLVLSSPKLAG